MRWTVLLAAALLLGACNNVTSTMPLFSQADAAGAPMLRDGLWLAESPKCRVNTKRPVQKWPDCAAWFIVRGDQLLYLDQDEDGKSQDWTQQSFVLAAGEPRILQTRYPDRTDATTGQPIPPGYAYTAVAPTASDPEGRIVGGRRWTVECGPPEISKEERGIVIRGRTTQPFPGIVLLEGGGCEAGEAETVRRAAVSGMAFAEFETVRWVRDTFP